MTERTLATKRGFILYDDALTGHVHEDLFSAQHWERHEALRGNAGGRGRVWFIASDKGEWVLRHYRRGGRIAWLTDDRYLWTGLTRTRPWREWRLLDSLYKEGLPVPEPVAAQVTRGGRFYRGDLITRRIPDSRSLAALLADTAIGHIPWVAIGACVRRLHNADVYHADLNAHNILINDRNEVFLIDFDKGERRTKQASWQAANLRRLQRSLRKLSARSFIESNHWNSFLEGYRQHD